MTHLDMEKINAGIADRSDVFYWQTDRAVEPEDAGHIWADRHRYFTDGELLETVNSALGDDKLTSIEPLDLDAQTNLGNVNSVRVGTLASGKEVVIRCHPKGVRNGYFHAEAAASHRAKEAGLPSFDTIAVHDYEGGKDFAFHVLDKLAGTAIKKWLEANPDDEAVLLPQVGKMMANWYPRIQELAVIAANLLHDPSDSSTLQARCVLIADEYSQFNPLTDDERKHLPAYALAGVAMEFMGAHQEKYINGNNTDETDYWLNLGRSGLRSALLV